LIQAKIKKVLGKLETTLLFLAVTGTIRLMQECSRRTGTVTHRQLIATIMSGFAGSLIKILELKCICVLGLFINDAEFIHLEDHKLRKIVRKQKLLDSFFKYI
jgi:hypothetical protein